MTTERILPAVALPVPARPRPALPRPAAVGRARPETAVRAKRDEALLTTPARAGMLIGASAAIYAVSLAGVSALQSDADAQLAARREPYLATVARTRAANDELEAALKAVGARAETLGGTYASAGDALAAYEARLEELAALVAEVQGSAAALPARISLPKVTVRASVGTARAPKTTSKSGASGG